MGTTTKPNNPKYKNRSLSIKERVSDLLEQMTLGEKIAQLGSIWSFEILEDQVFSPKKAVNKLAKGIGQITRLGGATTLTPIEAANIANSIQRFCVEHSRLGIPALIHEECCSGLMTRNASLFPQTLCLAASWNPEAMEEMTRIISRQMNAIGAHQGLSPVLDVTRDPRWGRTEETFGEDPYLTAKMGCAYIKGLQEPDGKITAIATGKHFVGYGASEGGKNWAPTNLPERELHEVYLFPFEAAIKEAGLMSIMNSYSEIDGQPCCASKKLFQEILRDAWEFKGLVVSDYFAINMLIEYHQTAADKKEAAIQAVLAGIDVELPASDCYGAPLEQAVSENILEETKIDLLVKRVLTVKFQLGLFESPYIDTKQTEIAFKTGEFRKLSRKLAAESIILLKNNNILPLSDTFKNIAVIGPGANEWRNMIGDYAYPCHIETLIETKDKENPFNMSIPDDVGDISGAVEVITLFESLSKSVSKSTNVSYAKGCNVNDRSIAGFGEAVKIAMQADISIVVVGDKSGLTDDCTSGEARDSATLKLPGVQEQLIESIIETGKPIIIVLISGRPYSITKFENQVEAVLMAGLPGEEGGNAIADILLGNVNPSGKLPISYPRSVGQIPVFYSHKPSGGRSHWKGSYMDESEKPLYPFGHGLSYTQFNLDNLSLSQSVITAAQKIEISCNISNIGKITGSEVVQLYIRYHPIGSGLSRPVKELKGFKKVRLKTGEKRQISFTLYASQLAYYKSNMNFALSPGKVEVMIGVSSQDIRLTDQFDIVIEKETIVQNRKYFSNTQIS